MAAKRSSASKKQARIPSKKAPTGGSASKKKSSKSSKSKKPVNGATLVKSVKPASKPAKGAKPVAMKGVSKTKTSAVAEAKSGPAVRSVTGLREGDLVPSFSLVDQRGEVLSSDSLAGEPLVLYFYPKDDTPGCSREACGFRDDHGKFQRAGITVIGVSPDDTKSHARFSEKYGLNFTLLSDAEKKLANAFGVWVKKQNYGREYMGIERSTFLVDASGKIEKAWRGVRVDGHVAAVLAAAAQS